MKSCRPAPAGFLAKAMRSKTPHCDQAMAPGGSMGVRATFGAGLTSTFSAKNSISRHPAIPFLRGYSPLVPFVVSRISCDTSPG
ncbi:hypothetical protein CEXT_295991 [Caerostris extrusa]|uniref:Uncharacterized protein n=1 Tax=Caerostris extrusa TaxID=172846 RepID=A0AAV4UUM3_CAEEX|nr:hypothetical protein CEXT_295991 [Caerostris extrusa]